MKHIFKARSSRKAWLKILLFILFFFFPLFLEGKRKGEKNNQSSDFKSCLSARSKRISLHLFLYFPFPQIYLSRPFFSLPPHYGWFKRYLIIDQQIARHSVQFSKCLSTPLPFQATQIITPFLNSRISANHD